MVTCLYLLLVFVLFVCLCLRGRVGVDVVDVVGLLLIGCWSLVGC